MSLVSELSVNEWMREARLCSTYLYLESENITGSDWAETSDFKDHNKRGGLVGGKTLVSCTQRGGRESILGENWI